MRCHPQPSPAPDVGAVSGWYARWQRCPSGGNETERRCLRVLAGSAELSAPCHLASFSVPTGRSPVWMTVCAIVRSFTWVMISDGNEAAQHPEPFTWSDFFPQFFPPTSRTGSQVLQLVWQRAGLGLFCFWGSSLQGE